MDSILGFSTIKFAVVRLKLEYDSMTWDNADDQHRQVDLGAAQEHAQRTIDSTTNRLLEERTVLGSAHAAWQVRDAAICSLRMRTCAEKLAWCRKLSRFD